MPSGAASDGLRVILRPIGVDEREALYEAAQRFWEAMGFDLALYRMRRYLGQSTQLCRTCNLAGTSLDKGGDRRVANPAGA